MLETPINKRNIKNGRVSRKKRKKQKKIRTIVIILITFILVLNIGHRILVNRTCKKYDKLIYPGVKVENINLSGKTKLEAMNILKNAHENKMSKNYIIINIKDKSYKINLSDLNINYNLKGTIDKAFNYGKDKSLKEKYKIIKKKKDKDFEIDFKYDNKAIKSKVDEIEKLVNVEPVNASMKKEGEDFITSNEKYGKSLNCKKLINDIEKIIKNKKFNNSVVIGEINKVSPKIKESEIKKINKKIVSFSTNFNNSSYNRKNNINLAAKAINGTVIVPGDVFSFNEVVGERTGERGYKEAPVIVNDKIQSDFGGGVCQVSTTLHNAILRTGIIPTERQHHTLPVSYVPAGVDATVSYGSIDYKFKNTLPYAIYIESGAQNKTLTFNIYSNSKLMNKSYDIVSEKEIVREQGKVKDVFKVYKICYENRKEIKREKINVDSYKK